MPRRLRKDRPATWHHVWNRGIAKRTLFETRRDVRFFLSCIARQVRAGDIEVHAYAVLTTHFHLLVRSPHGRLSTAMQRAQDAYARWFNIARRRDGPLFRGRFGNRIIDSDAYWWTVLQYIDRNPVDAGLCTSPRDYPHGSARHYCRRRGPCWLRRDTIESACLPSGNGPWDPTVYERFADEPLTPGQRWVAERRRETASADGIPDPLDDLLDAAPERVRRWMEAKALLADGTPIGHVLVAPGTVSAVLALRRVLNPGRSVEVGRKDWPFWEVIEAGLLREHCGLRFRELARETGLSVSTIQVRLRMHAQAMRSDGGYLAEAGAALSEAIARDHGGGTRRILRIAASGGAGMTFTPDDHPHRIRAG